MGVKTVGSVWFVFDATTPIPTEGSALQGRTAAAEQSHALLIPAYAPWQREGAIQCSACPPHNCFNLASRPQLLR
jgi:hypothetical protein